MKMHVLGQIELAESTDPVNRLFYADISAWNKADPLKVPSVPL